MAEVLPDADTLQIGIAVGQAGQWPAGGDPLQCRQAVRIQLHGVARGEVDFPQGVHRRRRDAAGGKGVLQGELALRGDVMGQVEPFVGDPCAQLAHGPDRPDTRDVGMVAPQPRVDRMIGAFQRRGHRPQGVVQVDREREYPHVTPPLRCG